MNHWHEKNKQVSKSTIVQQPAPELNIARAHVRYEIRRRAPWILLSVVAGIIMIWVGQSYEEILSKKIQLVFFIPVIVYMSDSIGTETLALFIRELALRRLNLKRLIVKEALVGLSLGIVSGVPMGVFSYAWFQDVGLSITVTLAMVANGIVAVMIGMLFPFIFAKFGRDPALGTDEITTALSDNLSMLIYLLIATIMLFGV